MELRDALRHGEATVDCEGRPCDVIRIRRRQECHLVRKTIRWLAQVKWRWLRPAEGGQRLRLVVEVEVWAERALTPLATCSGRPIPNGKCRAIIRMSSASVN